MDASLKLKREILTEEEKCIYTYEQMPNNVVLHCLGQVQQLCSYNIRFKETEFSACCFDGRVEVEKKEMKKIIKYSQVCEKEVVYRLLCSEGVDKSSHLFGDIPPSTAFLLLLWISRTVVAG